MLLKPLRYVFYRILVWKLGDPRESTPVLVAAFGTVVLLLLNFIAATMVVNGLRGHQLLPPLPGGRGGSSTLVLLCFGVGYYAMKSAWVENDRYARLEREFQSQDSRTQRRRTVLFWIYVILSAALPFLLSIFWPR